ncbi:MAG TPA: hypothetical protein VD887_11040 [Allosphingosinicella sp.]|nr:hypothetical protein [Allosphingosinicella sp.]
MVETRFEFENKASEPIDVYVEPWPHRFRLRPGQRLEFRYEAAAEGDTVSIYSHDDGITLWTGVSGDAEFLIDGENAEHRSWED